MNAAYIVYRNNKPLALGDMRKLAGNGLTMESLQHFVGVVCVRSSGIVGSSEKCGTHTFTIPIASRIHATKPYG